MCVIKVWEEPTQAAIWQTMTKNKRLLRFDRSAI